MEQSQSKTASEMEKKEVPQAGDSTTSTRVSCSAAPTTIQWSFPAAKTSTPAIPLPDPTTPVASMAQVQVNGSGTPDLGRGAPLAPNTNSIHPQPQPLRVNVPATRSDTAQLQAISTISSCTAGAVDSPHTVETPAAGTATTAPTQPKPLPVTVEENQTSMDSQLNSTTTVPGSTEEQPDALLKNPDPAPAPALVTNPIQPAAPAAKDAAPVAGGPKTKRKTSTVNRSNGNGSKGGKKRKSGRFDDDDDDVIRAGDSSSDESDEPTPTTTMTKSGRQIHRPTAFVPPQQELSASPPTTNPDKQPARKKKRMYRKGRENNVTCVHCWRGHSPASNAIVFCDDCNGAWHQFCHDPPIATEVITVKEAQWFCRECRPVEGESPATAQSLHDRPVPNEIFPVASQVLVGGSLFTSEQRRGYLSGLSHAALVKLLVDISDSNPELPIFPENLPELPSSVILPQSPKVSKATIDLTPSTATPAASVPAASAAEPTIEQTASNASPSSVPSTLSASEPASAAPAAPAPRTTTSTTKISFANDEDEDIFIEHRLYPRAGNGFRLPPDSVDLDMLLEDPSCKTFSHALHGPAKQRAEASAAQQAISGLA
ncbi:hypothetical protein VTO42DRAFT_4721 [Malbranchea cinnamomea]